MNNIARFASLISIAIVTIKLGLSGLLTPSWLGFIAVCSVLILAGGPRVLRIVVAVASLALFVRYYGGGNPEATSALLTSVLTLAIVLGGMYIMFRGVFRTTRR